MINKNKAQAPQQDETHYPGGYYGHGYSVHTDGSRTDYKSPLLGSSDASTIYRETSSLTAQPLQDEGVLCESCGKPFGSMEPCQAARPQQAEGSGAEALAYWREGHKIVEECLARAVAAKHVDAPFPLDETQAALWHRAQAEAYRHALEMMGVPSSAISTPPLRGEDREKVTLERLIARLPTLDLTWSDDLQAKWWQFARAFAGHAGYAIQPEAEAGGAWCSTDDRPSVPSLAEAALALPDHAQAGGEPRDVFERPFDEEGDPRLEVARVITRTEAAAILEFPGDLKALGGETGWLIETRDDDGTPSWLTVKPTEALFGLVFTKDSTEALRFCRRQDAEDYYACHIDDAPNTFITEHAWPALSASPAILNEGE